MCVFTRAECNMSRQVIQDPSPNSAVLSDKSISANSSMKVNISYSESSDNDVDVVEQASLVNSTSSLENANQNGNHESDNEHDSNNVSLQSQNQWTTVTHNQDLPKKNYHISYKLCNDDDIHQCSILSRGGKASTDTWHYLNVKEDNGNEKCMSFKNVTWKKEDVNEITYYGNTADSNNPVFEQAKLDEIRKWKELQAYVEVPDEGQSCISTRWVCTHKIVGDKVINKARLVVRGFEEKTLQMRSDSPTCNKESLRLILAILAAKRWKMHTLDVKSAFLQGLPINRDVYIRPPKCANTNMLWKLVKALYGLVDAGRHWYLRVCQECWCCMLSNLSSCFLMVC